MAPPKNTHPIPVLKPRLPSADAILPYLKRTDENQIYSNWGPLVTELAQRLCLKLHVPSGSVVCANSGMSALAGAILGAAGRAGAKRPLALVPDYTFTATALAVQMCGYEPVLASCDRNTWSFRAEDLLARPELLRRVGLVVPVAPFGRIVPQAPWASFQDETRIPVVIDGAACFDMMVREKGAGLGAIPVALSFHATKSFGTGEGGSVVTTDAALADRVFQSLNFGFFGSRISRIWGINGKMPEYTAAVGHAELDGWDAKHRKMLRVFSAYERAFEVSGIKNRLWGPPEISGAYVLLQCPERLGERVNAQLNARGIDTRYWYGDGLGSHDIFSGAKRLQVSDKVALKPRTLIGLPAGPDLTNAQIERIAAAVKDALAPR